MGSSDDRLDVPRSDMVQVPWCLDKLRNKLYAVYPRYGCKSSNRLYTTS